MFVLLAPHLGLGQLADDERSVEHRVVAVKVYRTAAQLTHTARVDLPQGIHRLVFRGLSPSLIPASLKASGVGGGVLQSVSHRTSYLNPVRESPRYRLAADSLKLVQAQVDRLNDGIATEDDLLALLRDNRALASQQTGLSLEALEAALKLHADRSAEVRERRRTLVLAREAANTTLARLAQELKDATGQTDQPTQEVVITLRTDKPATVTLALEYLASGGGWEPRYHLRAAAAQKTLELELNGGITNATGVRWEDVTLTLTTADPHQGGFFPELKPRYISSQSSYNPKHRSNSSYVSSDPLRLVSETLGINTVEGRVLDGEGEPLVGATIIVRGADGRTMVGTYSDSGGRFKVSFSPEGSPFLMVSYVGYKALNYKLTPGMHRGDLVLEEDYAGLDEVVVYGYGVSSGYSGRTVYETQPEPTLPSEAYVDLSERALTTEYTIELPYTLPSDGQPRDVALRTWQLPVGYRHRAAPVADDNAFLEAEFTGWREQDLLPAPANVYYEGAYLTETFFNPNQTSDTLRIGLGRDTRVRLQRVPVRELSTRQSVGANQRHTRAYRITVSNNQPRTVALRLEDLVPVSTDSRIKVEVTEAGGGQFNPETGVLTWQLTLGPSETKVITFGYEIRYPKNLRVHGLD
ncbi:MAG: mucoidy inhibitor MuiA family protein [Bacteroidia bacterium]|nr:mucoidy inhibitor MuiA family protein [Bacteroidia bacterium]